MWINPSENDKHLDAYFEAIDRWVCDCELAYGADFKQGFIKKSELEYLFQQMLKCQNLRRPVGGEMYLDNYHVKFVNNRLYLHDIYFKVEDNSQLYSPFAIYIKNAQKPVRYYNTIWKDDDLMKFYQVRDISEIMAEYELSAEEAVEYEKMMKGADFEKTNQ